MPDKEELHDPPVFYRGLSPLNVTGGSCSSSLSGMILSLLCWSSRQNHPVLNL